MKKVIAVSASVATFVSLCSVAFAYTNSSNENQVEKVAAEALVYDLDQGSMFRMNESNSASSLQVHPEPQLSNDANSTSQGTLIEHLNKAPDLTKKLTIDQAQQNQHRQKLEDIASQIFSPNGKYMTNDMNAVDEIIQNDDTPRAFQVDSGIDQLTWTSINIDTANGTATLKATGDSWASFANWENDHYVFATPHGIMNWTVTLSDNNGTWLVDSIDRVFANGYQP